MWVAASAAGGSYDPENSSTYVEPDVRQAASILFGSGTLEGYFANDFCMVGEGEDALSIENLQFGIVTKGNVFSTGSFDSIIGLAYPAMAEPNHTPFFDSLMELDLVEKNLFAFYMSMNPLEDDSELSFGSYDPARFEGELHWHDVADKLFWSLNLDEVRLGDESLGFC